MATAQAHHQNHPIRALNARFTVATISTISSTASTAQRDRMTSVCMRESRFDCQVIMARAMDATAPNRPFVLNGLVSSWL